MNTWQWAEKNVVFSKAYPTSKPGPYDPNYLPFLKEPQEDLNNFDVSKIVFLKNSQAGVSENLLINPIRYTVACDPAPVMYVGAQRELTEAFFNERIKPALRDCKETYRYFKNAKVTEHEIYMHHMMIAVTWAKSVAGLKSRPVKLVLADEVSVWPEDSIGKLEKRADTYPDSKIVIVSAPEPKKGQSSDKDPIFREFENSDQRYFMMPDPETGELFKFEMGFKKKKESRESKHGLKWSDKARRADGTWDLEKVRSTAHYLTPCGTVIKSSQKNVLVLQGKWVPTKKNKTRGYHINCFYMPWVDFGDIAVKFLESTKSKAALRVFVLEWLAEKWRETVEVANESEIKRHERDYERGQHHSKLDMFKEFYINKKTVVYTTADVQKYDLWTVTREWVEGGDSGLIDYRKVLRFSDIDAIAREHNAEQVLIDSKYPERRQEVYEASMSLNFIPTKGHDSRLSQTWLQRYINPYEGTAKKSPESLMIYIFDTYHYKAQLMGRIKGEIKTGWWVFAGVDRTYRQQMISEEKVDGKYVLRSGHKDNHLWDCEVLQVLAATIYGLNSKSYERQDVGQKP